MLTILLSRSRFVDGKVSILFFVCFVFDVDVYRQTKFDARSSFCRKLEINRNEIFVLGDIWIDSYMSDCLLMSP